MLDVVIVGAGPVGLMLACELRLAGARPVVLERLPEPTTQPRANGLVGQVVRLLDHRGLYERFTGDPAPPGPAPAFFYGALPLPLVDLDPNPLYMLRLPQPELERLLGERAQELGVEVRRGHEVRSFDQDDEAVTLRVAAEGGDHELHTRYLVGCDGGHSTVRKQSAIAFPGVTMDDVVSRVAHVSMLPGVKIMPSGQVELPGVGLIQPAFHRTERGVFTFAAFLDADRPLVNTLEWEATSDGDWPGEGTPMTLEEMRRSVGRVLGVDLPLEPPPPGPAQLGRRVGRNTRLAERYRAGRVFIAGDAAHVHSGAGGPGLNLGLQDAANLAWKLAAEIEGWAPTGLLDTYEAERRALGARVFMQTQAQTALMAPGPEVTALRQLFDELLRRREIRQHIADLMAGADVRYEMRGGDDGALTGRFAPDFRLTTRDESALCRVAHLMRDARPVLLDLTRDGIFGEAAGGWADRVRRVWASAQEQPASALLIRPDGYVAWAAPADSATARSASTLRDALRTWFGEPAEAA